MLRFKKSAVLTSLGAAVMLLVTSSFVRAQTRFFVDPGYDLFQTMGAGTSFNGIGFQGVPLKTFNFGNGSQGVGLTDTIIQRTQQAAAPGGGTGGTDLMVKALQLRSQNKVQLGNQLTYLFATLNTSDPAKNQGHMTINFNGNGTGGTFSSFFDVFFDLRAGGVHGKIVDDLIEPGHTGPFDINLSTSTVNNWGRTPPPGAEVITGVNSILNKTDTTHDFWVMGTLQHDASGAAHHLVTTAPVPEGGMFLQFGALMMICGGFLLRRQRRHA